MKRSSAVYRQVARAMLGGTAVAFPVAKARPGLLELEEVGKDHPEFAGRRARPVLLVRTTATGNQTSCAALRRGINKPRLLARRIA